MGEVEGLLFGWEKPVPMTWEMLEQRLEILFLDLAQVPTPAVEARKPRRKLTAPVAKGAEVSDYLQQMRSDLELRLRPE